MNSRESIFANICSNSACFSPQVTLIPITTSSNPISFRRSEDLSIVSIINYNCNQPFAMKTQWMITNCTTSCSNQIQLNSTIITTSSELYIPSQTLSYGIYQFELTITMANSTWLNISKSTYIQIIPSSIIVSSFTLGTLMITMGNTHDLFLDTGNYSIDLDNNVFNTNVSLEMNIFSCYSLANRIGHMNTIVVFMVFLYFFQLKIPHVSQIEQVN